MIVKNLWCIICTNNAWVVYLKKERGIMLTQLRVISLSLLIMSFLLSASEQKKQAVLVTGGAGYVGSHIAFVMAQNGYEVFIIDRKIKKQFPWATYICADYADEKALAELFTKHKIECVFHCAAYAIVPESFGKASEFYENNIEKTIKLLRVMRSYDVNRIVFASSRSVYGDAKFSPITEEHPTNPLSPYARTKIFAEAILKDLHNQYGLEYVALRFVNVVGAMPEYGLGEDHTPETHVFPLVMHAAKYHNVFYIYGTNHATSDGTCVRSYIHVHDIATANYLAFQYLKNGGKPDIFQLGSPVVLSIKQMIKAVEDFYHTTIETVVLPRRSADSPELISDYSKAQKVLGWEPQYSTIQNIIASADSFDSLI